MGLLLVIGGIYGVLVAGSLPGGGIPFVAVGAVLVGAGLAAGGRRTERTRYRPDPWRAPEWLVSASGVVVVGSMVAAGLFGAVGIEFAIYPLGMPTLPALATVGILVGLLPAWVAPVEQRSPRAGQIEPVRVPRDAATDGSDGRGSPPSASKAPGGRVA